MQKTLVWRSQKEEKTFVRGCAEKHGERILVIGQPYSRIGDEALKNNIPDQRSEAWKTASERLAEKVSPDVQGSNSKIRENKSYKKQSFFRLCKPEKF